MASHLKDFFHMADQVLEHLALAKGSHPDMPGIVCLTGELGAGKTTLVQHMAARLGIKEIVHSPTFPIRTAYDIPQHIHKLSTHFSQLIHIDAYRIETLEEAKVIKIDQGMQNPGHIICIEWPEHIEPLIPKERITVSLSHVDGQEDMREIIIRNSYNS